MSVRSLPALAILSAVLLVGCGSGDKMYDVSGTVTYDGRPIPKGLIFFDPDGSKGTPGTQGYANIENGVYDTANKGKGIRGGHYDIRISGYDGKPADEAPFGKALFPEVQLKKELPAEKQTFDHNVPKKP